jgi:hypothetical protein
MYYVKIQMQSLIVLYILFELSNIIAICSSFKEKKYELISNKK